MFITNQNKENITYYERMLKAAGSLSNLFSESPQPYLGYRLVENLFCKSFNAENLSRSDTSIDASKNKIGIGIKTFTRRNGKSFEKIAEFNRDLDLLSRLRPENKIIKIAKLRNERLDFAKRTYDLNEMIYHCVVRDNGKFGIYETQMQQVDISKINKIEIKNNTLRFSDDKNSYSFNNSKSTLYKQFLSTNSILDFPVKIIKDPFEALENILQENISRLVFPEIDKNPHVFLPLYSMKSTGEKYVPEKSSLNQWNAGGRQRSIDEVYIKIPAFIHKRFPGFFPKRDIKFQLQLPNKEFLSAKVCQENNKALMSDPNAKLGEWILRNVMNLKEGELLTYNKLEALGLDSVIVYKTRKGYYKIDFAKTGSFETFLQDANLPTP